MEDWREYRNMIEFDDFHRDRDRLLKGWPFLEDFDGPQEWLTHRAQMANHAQIDFDDLEIEGNAKPKSRKVRRSFISRMLNLL